jgi:hypothetical protein
MGGGHPSAVTPRRQRRRRRTLATTLTTLGLAVLALVAVTALRVATEPAGGQGFGDGPIVALGGGARDRLDTALELRQPTDRVLVLSGNAILRYTAWVGSCGEPTTICMLARPLSTFGEAKGVADLVDEHGWPHVTVVTSDYHAFRTRLLFERCVDVPVAVIGVPGELGPLERATLIARETIASIASLVQRCG